MAAIVNVPLTEGDTPSRIWALTSAGTTLDLTGATVAAYIKPNATTADGAQGTYTLTSGSGLTVVSAAAGTVQLDIPSAVTTAPSWWWYKIRVTRSGRTETAVEGWIAVSDA